MINITPIIDDLIQAALGTALEKKAITVAAGLYVQLEDWGTALNVIRLAEEQDAVLQEMQLLCLIQLPDLAVACEYGKQAVENFPDNVSIVFLNAQALLKNEQAAAAIAALEHTLTLDPQQLDAYIQLAEIYIGAKDNAAGILILENAEIECGEIGLAGNYLMGLCLGSLGRNEEAALPLAKAVSYNENFYSGWFNLAACMFRLNREEEAHLALARIPQWQLAQYQEQTVAVQENAGAKVVTLESAAEVEPGKDW
jgi:tetratricopeptide (TPR) repeat protein